MYKLIVGQYAVTINWKFSYHELLTHKLFSTMKINVNGKLMEVNVNY